MDSYDNLKSFYGSERGVVSLDELSFFINTNMVFQYNLPLADFNSSKCSFIFASHFFLACFFFKLFTLFRCCLYFLSVSTDFTLRKVLQKRSRIRISLLKAESNQPLSSFLIITSLVGIHLLAIFKNIDVKSMTAQ